MTPAARLGGRGVAAGSRESGSGVPATSPFSSTVTLVDLAAEQSFTATARVTDATGITGNPQTLQFTVGATRNAPPSIDNIAVNGTTVTVTVSDPDGDTVTVTLDSATGGLVGSPASRERTSPRPAR